MAKNKLVKGNKGVISFEKDEKKSIIIALVVSAVVVLATVLAIIAIRKGMGIPVGTTTSEEVVDTYTVTDTITEDGSIIVTNQEELDAKLTASTTDDTIGSITIQTEEEQSLEIPEGDYSQVALNIDAPFTEVSNYANFNTINISQISANTWIEHAQGNNLILQAMSCHVVVETDGVVESISNINYGSTLAIEIYGKVNELSLEAEDSISSISVEGTLGNLDVYSKTNLAISGSGGANIPVKMQSGADGSIIKATVPIDLETSGTVDLYMQEGSEASNLVITNPDVITNLYNNTTTDLNIKDPDNKEITVSSGEAKSFGEIKQPETPADTSSSSNTGSGSGSSSSSSSSSGSSSGGNSTVSSGSTGSRSSGSSSSSSSSTETTVTPTPTPTPKPTATPTPTPKPTPTPTPKATPTPTPKTDLEKQVEEQKSIIDGLKETIANLTTSSEETKEQLDAANEQLADLDERIAQKIKEAAWNSTISDELLYNPAYKTKASEEGAVEFRFSGTSDYLTPQRYPSKNPNNAEYIGIENHQSSNKSYLVQLYYYYFIDKETGDGTVTAWNEFKTSKAAVINPGEKWIFARPKAQNPNATKYLIEIIVTEKGPGEYFFIQYEPIYDNGEFTVCMKNVEDIENKDFHYIQEMFLDQGQVVGVTTYNVNDLVENAITDMDIDVNNAVRTQLFNSSTSDEEPHLDYIFTAPEGMEHLDWLVFVS